MCICVDGIELFSDKYMSYLVAVDVRLHASFTVVLAPISAVHKFWVWESVYAVVIVW